MEIRKSSWFPINFKQLQQLAHERHQIRPDLNKTLIKFVHEG